MSKPRVLIVEDEIIVALFIEDILAEFGYEVAGVVSQLDEAIAREPDYGLAVLDVHLNGRPVFDFADTLAAQGTPFSLPPAMASAASRNGIAAAPCCKSPSSPMTSSGRWNNASRPGRPRGVLRKLLSD